MRLVVALGGNALLRRGEPLTHARQLANVERAAEALAPLLLAHEVVLTHGNGPQIGLLALQQGSVGEGFPLDVLGAETEGMIGYLLEQALSARLPEQRLVASLLTRVRVDPRDPAFDEPTKPIGPCYATEAETRPLAARRGYRFAREAAGWRRVVASPRPLEIVEAPVVSILLRAGVTPICAGGGGIPVVRDADGRERGVEAVVDKDFASSLLARAIGADGLLLLTDVASVEHGFGRPGARAIRRAAPEQLENHGFPPGSMGPKVDAACAFVRETGGFAAIGAIESASALLTGAAGTRIERGIPALETEPVRTDRSAVPTRTSE